MRPQGRPSAALALAGGLVHNTIEFGATTVLANRNGEYVIAVIWLALFALWWRFPRVRAPAAWAMAGFAALHLLGGAILTVLPLGVLPFEPEQSISHYLAHVVYGVTQLPILLLALRWLRTAP